MKQLLALFLFLCVQIGTAQTTDEDNLQKYWKYRDQLRKRFMKIGDATGESQPATVIIPNRQYGQADQTTGSIIQWRDGTITLGYYWMVLATEYRLLHQNNQDVQPTLNELYYAMVAFNRLDDAAEGYLSGNIDAIPNLSNRNGFFIRGDVRHNITEHFESDPPIANGPIQPDPGHPNQMRSDYEGWTNYDDSTHGNEVQTVTPFQGSSESLDHLTTILLGLRFIHKMVPNIYVQPTPADDGFYIKDECLAMIKRVVEYLNDTEANDIGQFSAKEWTLLQAEDETVRNAGYNCILQSYPITEMMKALFDSQESEMIGEPGEVRWQFKAGDICIDVGNGNGQGFDDSAFAQAVINAIAFSVGNIFLGEFITQNLELSILLAAQGAVWAYANCGTDFCCEAVDGPVIIEISNETIKKVWERIEESNFPLHADGSGIQLIETGDLSIKFDGVSVALPNFTPIPASEKMTDDDNVHIMLESAILGDVWGPEYIRYCSDHSHLVHLPMLYDLLHNNGEPASNDKTKSFYQNLLSLAPCVGPWAHPANLNLSAQEWSSANRLFHPGDRNQGSINHDNGLPDPEHRGYFPGIDYMLIYNAYHLSYQDQLPGYTKRSSCSCVEEITTLEELSVTHTIKRKFQDYKEKGIPIESYLAHNLNVNTAAAILDVKNDFIICSPDQATTTTLHLTNNAKMNIYDGNTVTVREGNKIKLSSGASIVAGITDTDYDGEYPIPTIELLPGAELIIESSARLYTKKGLVVNLHEGSKLTIDGGHCKPEQLTDVGITVINHGGTIEVINGGILRTRNNQEMVHSMINGTVLLDDGQWICENPSNAHSWFLQDCAIVANHSSVIEMNGHLALDHSTITFNHLSDLKINEGSIHVLEGSRLFWGGELVELKGHNASILFDRGQMEIAASKTFAPTHASAPSGFIEFKGYNDYIIGDFDLYMNQGSVMQLDGDHMEDLMLKVDEFDLQTTYVGPNADDITANNGSFVFSNCTVELCKGGDITTDFSLDANHVFFKRSTEVSVDGESVLYLWWEPHVELHSCSFDKVQVKSVGAPISALQTTFIDSDVELQFAHYSLSNCQFNGSKLSSSGAMNFCEIYNSSFDNGSDVWDESLVELRVDNSRFEASPVLKKYGVLSLACNRFTNTSTGVEVGNALLNMSGASAAGYNKFENVGTCVELLLASGLDLWEGYNNLSGYTQFCIHGSLDWACKGEWGSCETLLKTSNNYWGTSGDFNALEPTNFLTPDNSEVQIELYAQDGNNNCNITSEAPLPLGCDVIVLDSEPRYTDDCARGTITVRKTDKSMKTPANGPVSVEQSHQLRDLSMELGNPMLTGTEHFDGYTLDSALVAAASLMELYDSLGNDATAIALFAEILTSGLDRSNADVRWRMEWGRKQMKTAVESMFVDNELSVVSNQTAFETPVLYYVQVLNTMTDTVLTDSTYKDQFYVELDKGQLFRTIGQPLVAKYIFEHLGDCQLDSLEQARLNEWQQTVDFELALRTAYFEDSLMTDTIAVFVDTTLYPIPYNVALSNYYFGVWIGGPQDVAFVNCGEDLEFRTYIEQTADWNIFPNPAQDKITLNCPDDERAVITMYDSMGRMAYQRVINFGDQHVAVIELNEHWPAGHYVLCKETNGTAAFKRFVVVR